MVILYVSTYLQYHSNLVWGGYTVDPHPSLMPDPNASEAEGLDSLAVRSGSKAARDSPMFIRTFLFRFKFTF